MSQRAVGSDLPHFMVAVVRYDDAALAIHGNPDRAVELRCCAGAVRKPWLCFSAAGTTLAHCASEEEDSRFTTRIK